MLNNSFYEMESNKVQRGTEQSNINIMQCKTFIPGPNLILCSTVPTLSLNTWGMFLERKNVPQVLVGR